MSRIKWPPSADLREIVAHTGEAESWSNPYGLMPEMVTEMHLDLVKDSGIYLMSGNSKTLSGSESHNLVAYADGYNPKTDEDCWEESRHAVGGDDFCEPLPITAEIVRRIANGDGFFVEVLSGGRISYGTYGQKVRA